MGDNYQMTFFVFTFCAAPGKPGDNPGADLGSWPPSHRPHPYMPEGTTFDSCSHFLCATSFFLNNMLILLFHYFRQFLKEWDQLHFLLTLWYFVVRLISSVHVIFKILLILLTVEPFGVLWLHCLSGVVCTVFWAGSSALFMCFIFSIPSPTQGQTLKDLWASGQSAIASTFPKPASRGSYPRRVCAGCAPGSNGPRPHLLV